MNERESAIKKIFRFGIIGYTEITYMLKNLFIILVIITLYGCDTKPPTVITPVNDLPYGGICGDDYVETLKIHSKLFGDNPTIVVFDKIPLKESENE